MRNVLAAALVALASTAATAQDAMPMLKGTWRGTGKILFYGSTEHLSGSPGTAAVRDLEVSHTCRKPGGPADLGHDVLDQE
jgi:hypothetical protein